MNRLICLWSPSGWVGAAPETGYTANQEDIDDNKFEIDIIDAFECEHRLSMLDYAHDAGSGLDTVASCDISSIVFPFSTNIASPFPKLTLDRDNASAIDLGLPAGGSGIHCNLLFTYGLPAHAVASADESEIFYAPLGSGWHTSVLSSSGLPSKLVDSSMGLDDNRSYLDIRPFGMRLPMIGVGWGYTLEGKPVPNDSEDYTSDCFAGNKNYGWEADPETYVAAPIDFRYDQDRNVWVSAQAERVYIAEVIQTVSAIGSPYILRKISSDPELDPGFEAYRLEDVENDACEFTHVPVGRLVLVINATSFADGDVTYFTAVGPGGT